MAMEDRKYEIKYRGENLPGLQFGNIIELKGFNPDADMGHPRIDKIFFNDVEYGDPVTKNMDSNYGWYFYCPKACLTVGPDEPTYDITLTPIRDRAGAFNFLVGSIKSIPLTEDEDEMFGAESGGGQSSGGWLARITSWWRT